MKSNQLDVKINENSNDPSSDQPLNHLTTALKDVYETVHRLRAPGGCPWDRKQTHQSLRPFFIEETYEVIDVLDRVETSESLKNNESLKNHLIEELGDVMLQILLHSEIASESNLFSLTDVFKALNEKLIRRHPHVFSDSNVKDSEAVVKQWEEIKKAEKTNQNKNSNSLMSSETLQSDSPYLMDEISKGLPPLPRTLKIIEKVSKVGFQWGDALGALEKMEEEVKEFKDEIKVSGERDLNKIEDELGDVLFSATNVAYLLKIDPETALRKCLKKFERRFNHIEKSLRNNGKKLSDSNLNEMDHFWNEAKKIEKEKKVLE